MSERQGVIIGIFFLALFMLVMTMFNPSLWNVELFKVVLQAMVITGLLNMVTAFYFAANKTDDEKTENTAKAFEAITATANANAASTPVDAATGKSNDPVNVVAAPAPPVAVETEEPAPVAPVAPAVVVDANATTPPSE